MPRSGQERSADDSEGLHMLLRNRITRAAAAAALVLAVPTLSGCGMNFATDQVYTPAPGANDRDGRVDVLNGMIVASEDGKGTLIVTLVNNEIKKVQDGFEDVADQLTAVGGDVTPNRFKAVTIPGGGHVKLANPEDNPSGRAKIDKPGIKVTGDFAIGEFVEVELTFANADPVTMEVPVMANHDHLEGEDDGEPVPTLAERVEQEHAESGGESTGESH